MDRDDTPAAEWWSRSVKDGDTKGPARRLANLLKPYGIEPSKWGSGKLTARGYRRVDFEDAWSRYLPSTAPFQTGGLDAADAAPPDTQGVARNSGNAAASITPPRKPLQDIVRGVAASTPPVPGVDAGRTGTPEDSDLASLRRSAASRDWPALEDESGEIVRAGQKTWDRLLKTAPAAKIARAVAALKALDDEDLESLLAPEGSDGYTDFNTAHATPSKGSAAREISASTPRQGCDSSAVDSAADAILAHLSARPGPVPDPEIRMALAPTAGGLRVVSEALRRLVDAGMLVRPGGQRGPFKYELAMPVARHSPAELAGLPPAVRS